MRLLAALLLLSSLARAQPSPAPNTETDKAEALRLTDLGTQARLRGEAAAALAYFEDAYLIYPMPRLHFEIGLAQAAMGLNLAALLSFERFLKEGADESPNALEQARSEVARLEAMKVGAGETVKPQVTVAKSAPIAVEKPRRTWWIWTIAGVLAVGLVTTAVVLSLPAEAKGPCDAAAPGLGCVKFGGAP